MRRLWRVSGVLSGPGGRRRRGHGGWTAAPARGAAVGLGAAEPCQWSAILVSKVRTSVRSSWPRGRSGALVAPASAAAVFRRSRVGSQEDEERAAGATGRTPGGARLWLPGARLVLRLAPALVWDGLVWSCHSVSGGGAGGRGVGGCRGGGPAVDGLECTACAGGDVVVVIDHEPHGEGVDVGAVGVFASVCGEDAAGHGGEVGPAGAGLVGDGGE